jgi:hypothetical protein
MCALVPNSVHLVVYGELGSEPFLVHFSIVCGSKYSDHEDQTRYHFSPQTVPPAPKISELTVVYKRTSRMISSDHSNSPLCNASFK